MRFHEISHFLKLFFHKFIKTSKHDSLLKNVQVLAKSMSFHEMSHFLELFSEKFVKTSKPDSFLEKLSV